MMDESSKRRVIDANEHDWHNVRDAKERKKIQDRLAQRARRQRLKEAKNQISEPLSSSEPQIRDYPAPDSQDLIPLCLNQSPWISSTCMATKFDCPGIPTPPGSTPEISRQLTAIDYPLLPQIRQPAAPLSVFSALFLNGKILGLSCSTTVPMKSPVGSPDVPAPLRPTATQLITIHALYIDRFPFPKMRDNAISMSAVFDDEEFLFDIFTGPSFEILPGYACWDPRAWKIDKKFAEKWGFLFY